VLPIAIIYGAPRVQSNLIYYNGFSVQRVSQGGKGLLTGGKGAQQIEYFATIILSIGEGVLQQPLIIYQDSEVWTPATYPSNGAFWFSGSATQTPWSYISSDWPTDARPYKDTAYYGFSNAQLDSSATVPQINFVIPGILSGSSPLNNTTITITSGQYDQAGNPLSFLGNIALKDVDADPAQVIYDFLTNETYGATFPAEWVDTTTLFSNGNGFIAAIGDQALSTYCQAVGLAWSLSLGNPESGNSILERWCKNLGVAVVWNGYLLKFIPYWDTFSGANPGYDATNSQGIQQKYFNPYTVPIVTIPMDQILQSEAKDEDPITWSRKDPLEVYNTVRLDYRDRTNFFNNNTVSAIDDNHVELYGPRVDNIGLADEFTLMAYANVSAQVQLQRNISIVRNFAWKMGPLWGWLEPMYIVAIPDPSNYADTIIVRITGVEDDADENVSVTAEEYPVGSQSPEVIPTAPTTPPNQSATNSPPQSIYPPVMFAPTAAMLTAKGAASPQWIFGCTGGSGGNFDANWGGAHIWVSWDGISYQLMGTQTGAATMGALNAPLPGYGGTNPDNVQALSVDLAMSDGALSSVSASLAATGYSLCVLSDASGFEIIAYTTATLTAPFTYSLTGLYRGLYGTTPRFFGTGSQFMALAAGLVFFETTLPPSFVGNTVWIKGQSFNVYNTATEELSACVAYPYLVTSPTPVPPIAPPAMQMATYRRLHTGATGKQVPRTPRAKLGGNISHVLTNGTADILANGQPIIVFTG
jgi:hypothetical protein